MTRVLVREDGAGAGAAGVLVDHEVVVHDELHVLHEREVGADVPEVLQGAEPEQVSVARPHQMGGKKDRQKRKGRRYG